MQNTTHYDLSHSSFNTVINSLRRTLKKPTTFNAISKWNTSHLGILLTLLFIGLTNINTYAQTTLTAGDIVITGYNADGGDQFSFLLLVDIDPGTVINFTDQGWTGSTFFTGSATEGIAVWTSSSMLTCGTEIIISATDVNNSSADTGTTTGGFDFAISGDQIIAYQGPFGSPTFITAFHNESGQFDMTTVNVNDSALPTGLVEGISAFAVNPEIDNVVYSGTIISGAAEGIRAAIYSNSGSPAQASNWTTDNGTPQTLSLISWSFSSCLAPSDTTDPEIISVDRQTPMTSPTNADALVFSIEFSEEVVNVDPADFVISGGTTATVTAVADQGSNIWNITISGGDLADFNGNVFLGLIASQNIQDTAGNGLSGITDPTPQNFVVDNMAPTVSISAPSVTDTNTGPITYTITYTNADAVTLANGDVSLNTTGDATGTVAVTGSGTATRTVTISSITGDGTIGISLAAGTASDTAGNSALAAGPSATFNVDNMAPTLAIGAPSATDTNTGPITYTITYTNVDAVTLADGDVSLNTTGDATGTVAVTGSGTMTRTVTISSITGDGTIGISLAAGTANDTAGNTALAAGPSVTFNVDNTTPSGYTVGIDQAPINSTNETAVSFTFAGAEVGTTYNYTFTSDGGGTPVTGSGTISPPGTNQITGIDISGLADGTVTLTAILTDDVGNTGSDATDNIAKETTRPSVSITSTESPGPTGANPIPVTITFDEIVGGFTEGEITVVNGTTSNFSGGTGPVFTVDITPSGAGPLTITVDVAADVATDMSGNGNTAASQFSIMYDNLLGIDDELLVNGLTIYPIPSNSVINITGETNLGLQRAEIFDVQGKLIVSQKLESNSVTNTLDISSIGSGLYLMTVYSDKGSTMKRIVKQ